LSKTKKIDIPYSLLALGVKTKGFFDSLFDLAFIIKKNNDKTAYINGNTGVFSTGEIIYGGSHEKNRYYHRRKIR